MAKRELLLLAVLAGLVSFQASADQNNYRRMQLARVYFSTPDLKNNRDGLRTPTRECDSFIQDLYRLNGAKIRFFSSSGCVEEKPQKSKLVKMRDWDHKGKLKRRLLAVGSIGISEIVCAADDGACVGSNGFSTHSEIVNGRTYVDLQVEVPGDDRLTIISGMPTNAGSSTLIGYLGRLRASSGNSGFALAADVDSSIGQYVYTATVSFPETRSANARSTVKGVPATASVAASSRLVQSASAH